MEPIDFDNIQNASELGPVVAWLMFDDDIDNPDRSLSPHLNSALTELLGADAILLNSRMHDSAILSITRSAHEFTLTLNSFEGWALAETFARLSGSGPEPKEIVMPVEFRFEGLSHFSTHFVDDDGRLTPANEEALLNHPDCFLYDVPLFVEQNRTQIAMILHQLAGRHGSVLILVDASKFSILNRERVQWISLFGEDSVWIYDRMADARPYQYLPSKSWQLEDWLAKIGAPNEVSINLNPSQIG